MPEEVGQSANDRGAGERQDPHQALRRNARGGYPEGG